MVEQSFLDKLQSVCDALERSKGTVYLFAALKMDELTDKWTLVVSAAWVADTSFEDAFGEIRALLIEEFGEDINTFARIGIFNLNDHFTELIIQKYRTGDSIKEDQQINGNLIHEGYILKVQPLPSETAQTVNGEE